MNVLMGVHVRISDHFLVEGKLKVMYKWRKRKEGEDVER